jgi:hypothetical protein
MSRRAFYPTAEQRGKVEEMIGYGLSEAEICLLFKNPGTGKTIDLRTFRKSADHRQMQAGSRRPGRGLYGRPYPR